jgi:type VI secretion system secreted protein VgrG
MPFDDRFRATLSDGSPARDLEYTLIRRDGGRVTGKTDSEGFLSLQQDMRMDGVLIEWRHDNT